MMNNNRMLEPEINDLVKTESEIKTLAGLLNQYSPTGKENNASAWLVARMQEIGYTKSFVDEMGNAIGIMGSGSRQIILLGHIDTVRGIIPLRLVGDHLYGRGSVDAKGPLSAFVDAVAHLGPIPEWEIIVIGAVDEEGESTGARSVSSIYHPEYAIVGEPSNWDRIALGYKGSAWGHIKVTKPKIHTSREDSSAWESVLNLWVKIKSWVDNYNLGQTRIFDQIQVTLRGWNSSEGEFEDWAQIKIGARLPPNFHPEQWYELINSLLDEGQMLVSGFPLPSFVAKKNSTLVRAFLKTIRSENGKPIFVFKTGTCDANVVAQVWDCPVVVYGPGDSNLDHTAEEHININEFFKSIRVLEGVIRFLVNSLS